MHTTIKWYLTRLYTVQKKNGFRLINSSESEHTDTVRVRVKFAMLLIIAMNLWFVVVVWFSTDFNSQLLSFQFRNLCIRYT